MGTSGESGLLASLLGSVTAAVAKRSDATGGYEMSGKKNNKVTLLQVVNAIDGDKIYNGCGLGLKQCNAAKPCPLHHQFAAVRDQLKTMLSATTIQDLGNGLPDGLSFLKR